MFEVYGHPRCIKAAGTTGAAFSYKLRAGLRGQKYMIEGEAVEMVAP